MKEEMGTIFENLNSCNETKKCIRATSVGKEADNENE